MSGISFNSIVGTLRRNLDNATGGVEKSIFRLSSGMRINTASDDAAGLAVSSELNVRSRVFNQAVKNVSDAVSALNIAQGALEALTTISIRQKEIVAQAANGVYSTEQRRALGRELNELGEEHNRITEATSFNGRNLLDLSTGELRIQAGYGLSGGLSFDLGDELARIVGNGTYQAQDIITGTGGYANSIVTEDFNQDGLMDIMTSSGTIGGISVHLGNGDGTFQASLTFTGITSASAIGVGDFNNDGILDVANAGSGIGRNMVVMIGNGDGTFGGQTTYSANSVIYTDIQTTDIDNDGNVDILVPMSDEGALSVYLGNGDGTFKDRVTYSANPHCSNLKLSDFNGDGNLDAFVINRGNDRFSILLGNNDGTFSAPTYTYNGNRSYGGIVADFNNDNKPDLALTDNTSSLLRVYIGNGDGTFQARQTYQQVTNGVAATSADINGDGFPDILVTHQTPSVISTFFGNGDGTFKEAITCASISGGVRIAAEDFNQDGSLDIISTRDYIAYQEGNIAKTTTVPYLRLFTPEEARSAMSTIDATLERISSELGSIGSTMSRLEVAANVLKVSRENMMAAHSRIVDADVAEETAGLTKNKILQEIGTAILSHANQSSSLILDLLRR